MNLFEKSSPPVSRLTGGMMTSLTSEVTIDPKAAPMITPTARSKAFPLTANSLNSFHMPPFLQSNGNNVNKFFRHNHDFDNGFACDQFLDLRIGERRSFNFALARQDRHLHSVAHFSIYLYYDFDFVFGEKFFIVTWPRLSGDIAAAPESLPQ